MEEKGLIRHRLVLLLWRLWSQRSYKSDNRMLSVHDIQMAIRGVGDGCGDGDETE